MKNVTLFAQIMQTVDRFSFTKLVNQYGTDKHSKAINSWTHLVTMLFCQLSKLNSLRDVCNGLQSASGNLNHLGVARAPCKSSLSYQNKHRDWQLFKDYYFEMMKSSVEWPGSSKPASRSRVRFCCWTQPPSAFA